ncbi:MAG: hypothetical protein V3R81_02090 [Gammaproteobacteria bacterium]
MAIGEQVLLREVGQHIKTSEGFGGAFEQDNKSQFGAGIAGVKKRGQFNDCAQKDKGLVVCGRGVHWLAMCSRMASRMNCEMEMWDWWAARMSRTRSFGDNMTGVRHVRGSLLLG